MQLSKIRPKYVKIIFENWIPKLIFTPILFTYSTVAANVVNNMFF